MYIQEQNLTVFFPCMEGLSEAKFKWNDPSCFLEQVSG